MGSPFTGILTSVGAANILGASGTGSVINVTSFAVSSIAGELDPNRATTNSTWYSGNFYPAATIIDNKVDVTMVIPPTSNQLPLADGNLISELYLFANLNGGEQFLLGIIHPPDNNPITYSNIVEYDIILEIQFSESNLTGIFNFTYNAGDVEAHNNDVNAHQKRWVLKAGDTMSGALHEAIPVSRSTNSGILTLTESANSFVVTGTEAVTSITGWIQGIARIRWTTSRTLTNNNNTLKLITGTNRVTQIDDVGVYEFTSSGCREIGYFPKSGYVNRLGDNILGDLILDNNIVLKSKDSNGNLNNISYIDSTNVEQIGSTKLPLNFNSSVDPKVMIGSTPQTMYHTGNLKISNLVSYAVNSGNVDTLGRGNLLYQKNMLDNTVLSFKVGTVEYTSDPSYGYISKGGSGSGSIVYSNNIYSLNGTNQFLAIPKVSTFGLNTWTIQTKIKFNAAGTAQGIIGTGIGGNGYGICLERQITSNKLMLKGSYNGTAFAFDGSTTAKGLGTYAFSSTSAYYWIRVSFNGNAYKVYYSTDGNTWVNDIQVNSGSVITTNFTQLCLGVGDTTPLYLNGSIDMSGTKFTLNSKVVFDGSTTYTAPNVFVTFPSGKTYEISKIEDITGLSNDGTYTIILEEDNLINNGNNTYYAIANAIKLGYSYNGLLPQITDNSGGYNITYSGNQGYNPYSLVNGSNSGISFYSTGGTGNIGFDISSTGSTVSSVDTATNKITFSGEHVSSLYGTDRVYINSTGFYYSTPVYNSTNNTTTITLTAYQYPAFDGSGSNYNMYTGSVSAAQLNALVGKTVYAKELSTFILKIPTESLANSFVINCTDSAGDVLAISYSDDNGATYQTSSITTLNTGINTISTSTYFTHVKFSIRPRHWAWEDGGGQYWVHHEYCSFHIASINLNTTVSLPGGNITEDYYLTASNAFATVSNNLLTGFTSNTKGDITLSSNWSNSTAYLVADGDNNTMWANAGHRTYCGNPYPFIPGNGGSVNLVVNFGASKNLVGCSNLQSSVWYNGSGSVYYSTDGGTTWTYLVGLGVGRGVELYVPFPQVVNCNAIKFEWTGEGSNPAQNGDCMTEGMDIYGLGLYEAITQNTVSTSGDYFLNLSTRPYKPLKGTNTGWIEKQFLKLGEVTKTGGVLGTPVTYAYNGMAIIKDYNVTTSGHYQYAHNLGTDKVDIWGYWYNISGVNAGQYAGFPTGSGGYFIGGGFERYSGLGYLSSLVNGTDKKTVHLWTGLNGLWAGPTNSGTYGDVVFSLADPIIYIQRSFL